MTMNNNPPATTPESRELEREALHNVIQQWNANRLDLFELSPPNANLEFHGVMRFYYQDVATGRAATKCLRVASDATAQQVVAILIEKFRPDMRMLTPANCTQQYALYEIHGAAATAGVSGEQQAARRLGDEEKPLLVQLNWHVDDRDGRFLLRNIDDEMHAAPSLSGLSSDSLSNSSFRRKLSKREKKQLKKQEKMAARLKSSNDETNEVAEKLYNELPDTSFTRSISNPEAVMRRRRQQKLEKRLQQFRSKDGGPDTGGTLKIYGEALCPDVPYKTLLLSVRDCAHRVVTEMLQKYGLETVEDASNWCLVQTMPGGEEYILDDDECPLAILMNHPTTSGSIMFHVRRRPADGIGPRKRKKKPAITSAIQNVQSHPKTVTDHPMLVEIVENVENCRNTYHLNLDLMEVGTANGAHIQLYGPQIKPRHCLIQNENGRITLTPADLDAEVWVNGQLIGQTTLIQNGAIIKFGRNFNTYKFIDPNKQHDDNSRRYTNNPTEEYNRSPDRALSPTLSYGARMDKPPLSSPPPPHPLIKDNYETTFDLDGNVETTKTNEDAKSVISEARFTTRGTDPILPAVLEFPETQQEQCLARIISLLDQLPQFKLAPAYTLYLCARYRASTHYRPELQPTERAHKLTLLLQHVAQLIQNVIQERYNDTSHLVFWLANSSELLNFLKCDRHISAFSLSAQETLAESVQLSFSYLITTLTASLNLNYILTDPAPPAPSLITQLQDVMQLLRMLRVNAALTIQLFSQLFHFIQTRCFNFVVQTPNLVNREYGRVLCGKLQQITKWAEQQGLELAAECHLGKLQQLALVLDSNMEIGALPSQCFKLNSIQLGTLLSAYQPQIPTAQIQQAVAVAKTLADELALADGQDVKLLESDLTLGLILPEDGYSCDVIKGIPPGLVEFLSRIQPPCRLAGQPTSAGNWTVYMSNQPKVGGGGGDSNGGAEIVTIKLCKSTSGMGLSIVAAKGAGQERLGIYVKSVVSGGAADLDGRLEAGDQLLRVDGQSLIGITQERAAEFLVRTGPVVTLQVAKQGAIYHGLATLLQQPSPPINRASSMELRHQWSASSSDNDVIIDKPTQHHVETGYFKRKTHTVYPVKNYHLMVGAPLPSSSTTTILDFSKEEPTIHPLDSTVVLPHHQHQHPFKFHKEDKSSKNRLTDDELNDIKKQLEELQIFDEKRPRRMSERDIPFRFNDHHPQILSSKSVPALHQAVEQPPPSIPLRNRPLPPPSLKSKSNLDLYQNLSIYRKDPRAGPANTTTRPVQEVARPQRPSSAYFGPTSPQQQRPSLSGGSIPNLAMVRGQVKLAEMGEEVMRRRAAAAGHHQRPLMLSPQLTPLTTRIGDYPPQHSYLSPNGSTTSQHSYVSPNGGTTPQQMYYDQQQQQQQQQPQQHQQFSQNHSNGGATYSNYYEQHYQQFSPVPPQQLYKQQPQQQQQQQQQQQLQQQQQQQHLQQQQLQQHQQQQQLQLHQQHEDPPPIPPTATHPLYSASLIMESPKGSMGSSSEIRTTVSNPWEREEREKAQEMRREQASLWRDSQISELCALKSRTMQQDEQLRALMLERDFQKRAREEEQMDINEEESTVSATSYSPQPVSSAILTSVTPVSIVSTRNTNNEIDSVSTPTSILKTSGGLTPNSSSLITKHKSNEQLINSLSTLSLTNEFNAPPPPERGSSYLAMSLRAGTGSSNTTPKLTTSTTPREEKRVSFNSLNETSMNEDPNVFISAAESMLASPATTPTAPGGGATPGVIGAQEVYRDPRTKRLLAEQQAKQQAKEQEHIPEKLSFKEKMKMFAMETGEVGTPKDKSKISRAQRDIDNIGGGTAASPQVH